MPSSIRAAAALLCVAFAGCGDAALRVHDARPERATRDSTVVVDCGGYAQVAPLELAVGCHEDGPVLEALKWRGWGEERAVANGRMIRDCAGCRPVTGVRVEAVGLVLRRDATLAYRAVAVTPQAGEQREPLRFQLFDGYLEAVERPAPTAAAEP